MQKSFLLTAVVAGICAGAPSAHAQWWGYGWGSPGWNSTTSGTEAAALGMSQVIQSRGQYQIDTAQAADIRAKAQADQSDADLKSAQDYFDMKRVNQQYQQEQYAKRYHPTQAALARMATDQLPPRMTLSKLDPSTGEIHWPELLMNPMFDQDRAAINKLFAERAKNGGGLGTNNHLELDRATKKMLDELKTQIRNVDTGDYLVCRQFIESLSFESRFPPNG